MKKYFIVIVAMIIGLSFTGFVSADDVSTYEELAYVLRTKTNEALWEEAQEFCQNAPFEVTDAHGNDFYSINTRGTDGAVVNWMVKKVGEGLTCSRTNDDGSIEFLDQYNFGHKNPITMYAYGRGQFMASDSPEGGIYPFTAYGWIYKAPTGYLRGYITANGLGGNAAELGYEPSSIITIRIFREWDAPGLFEDEQY